MHQDYVENCDLIKIRPVLLNVEEREMLRARANMIKTIVTFARNLNHQRDRSFASQLPA
jgi:hypothetical protein